MAATIIPIRPGRAAPIGVAEVELPVARQRAQALRERVDAAYDQVILALALLPSGPYAASSRTRLLVAREELLAAVDADNVALAAPRGAEGAP